MIILVESPYSGDIQRNSEYARRAMLHVIEQGHTPIVPHLLYPQVLDDSDPEQRETALQMCAELRRVAHEVWFFVDYGSSSGMERAMWEMVKDFNNPNRMWPSAGSKNVEIGQNPEGPSYRKLPIEQQLGLERQDRKGAFAALRRAEEKLKFARKQLESESKRTKQVNDMLNDAYQTQIRLLKRIGELGGEP